MVMVIGVVLSSVMIADRACKSVDGDIDEMDDKRS